jgi:NAD(P)-dependent dehydrogenase (short-subunit alcohol dehydrogenase family)
LTGQRADKLAATQASLGDRYAGAAKIDLRDPASIEAAVIEASKAMGGIEVCVMAAAGIVPYVPIFDIDRKALLEALTLKYVGSIELCRAVGRLMMAARKGVIINVIGINTDIAYPMSGTGGGANAALKSFTRLLAGQLAEYGVRVLGVSPGMVAGRRYGRFEDATAGASAQGIPLGHIAEPEEIADVITFLASPRAGYMTGAVVPVDGGLLIKAAAV